MATYESLMFEILPHVQSCPAPSVMASLRSEASQFFHEAQCWIHPINETTTEGLRTVTVSDLPPETRIVVPLEVFIGGDPVETANHRMMRYAYDRGYLEGHGQPEFIMLSDHSIDKYDLFPLPNDAYSVTGRIAIKPTRTANELPDAIMDEFADGLIHAALAKLMGMKNTEWYDAGAATFHMQKTRVEIDKAKSNSRRENTSRKMITTYGGL